MPRRKVTNSYSTEQLSLQVFKTLDLSEFTRPYKEIKKDYEKIFKKTFSKGHAYKVSFKESPNTFCIAFAKTKRKAIWQGAKFFHNNLYPEFMGKGWSTVQNLCLLEAHRIKELDDYSLTGIIPIPVLMKTLNMTFKCSVCGKGNFTYETFESGGCFVLEGEGNLNDYTKGYILCYDCKRKYLT